jgi:hypothetical protein
VSYYSQTQAKPAPRGVFRFDSDVNLANPSTASGQAFTEFAGSQCEYYILQISLICSNTSVSSDLGWSFPSCGIQAQCARCFRRDGTKFQGLHWHSGLKRIDPRRDSQVDYDASISLVHSSKLHVIPGWVAEVVPNLIFRLGPAEDNTRSHVLIRPLSLAIR